VPCWSIDEGGGFDEVLKMRREGDFNAEILKEFITFSKMERNIHVISKTLIIYD
jgi:hypothetical protein